MKFPLPVRPFPTLTLSTEDEQVLTDLADGFVQSTLAAYEVTLYQHNGVLDANKWKKIKTRGNVNVYQEREQSNTAAVGGVHDPEEPTETPANMKEILWYGTIDGDLNDFMYGVVNPTTEIMKIKSSYVPDNISDCTVLANIVHATPDDPFRGLQLKWCVNGGPAITRQFVRCRDFVYLESTGITRSSKDERIGYHIVHTMDIPGIRHLHEYKFVRANMTLYHLFRQKRDGVIEIYVKAIIDLLGDMPQSMAVFVTCEGVVSLSHAATFSDMKKLTYMVKTKKSRTIVEQNLYVCTICNKDFGSLNRKKYCQVCTGRVCHRCHVTKKLSFLAPLTRDVIQQSMHFCKRCLHTAVHTDGWEIASKELARERQYDIYEIGSNSEYTRASSDSFRTHRSGRAVSEAPSHLSQSAYSIA